MDAEQTYRVGLRIDVDTLRGTSRGVPRLLELFKTYHIQATFLFSVGPDNMGRHLWRLLKPAFLVKMLRSNAAALYGWDILLRGTLWPGPVIGKKQADVIRRTAEAGHETGLHAWDHHRWQAHLQHMSRAEIHQEIQLGMQVLQGILGQPPVCSAAAGWKCNERVIIEKDTFGYRYNSDCRGEYIFRPVVDGKVCTPQIPVTLPTYDELIGHDNITDQNYNEKILSLLRPDALNVLTIHAEVEGIARSTLFRDFLELARRKQVQFVPLGDILPPLHEIPPGEITNGMIAGREGDVCIQS